MPATYNYWSVANGPTTVSIGGPLDGFAVLMLGDWLTQPAPTPFGDLRIDPASLMFLDILFLPASATSWASKSYFVPPAVQYAHTYAMQSLTLTPAGALGLTMATPFCVGWEHGRLP